MYNLNCNDLLIVLITLLVEIVLSEFGGKSFIVRMQLSKPRFIHIKKFCKNQCFTIKLTEKIGM